MSEVASPPWLTFATPTTWTVRFFDTDIRREPVYGIDPWQGCCHLAMNEFGWVNVTLIITLRPTQAWWASLRRDLVTIGARWAYWSKVTAGRKRAVWMPIPENLRPEDAWMDANGPDHTRWAKVIRAG